MGIEEKIKEVREQKFQSKKEMATFFKVSERTITNWESGRNEPSIRNIQVLMKHFDIDAKWFFENKKKEQKVLSIDNKKNSFNNSLNSNKVPSINEETKGKIKKIPLYNVYASAGHGFMNNSAYIDGYIDIKDNVYKANKDNYFIKVNGESMEPILYDGDFILINHNLTNYNRKGIFLIRCDDELYVKRIQISRGQLILISDNAMYKEVYINKTDDFEVLGKVVFRMTENI